MKNKIQVVHFQMTKRQKGMETDDQNWEIIFFKEFNFWQLLMT